MDTDLYARSSTAAETVDGPAVGPPNSTPLRREQVYARLRTMIMLGEFGPHMRLVEERLATRLEVSRTPIREALVRLVTDGLITRRDDGYFVAVPDLAQLRNLYELRITLELRGITRVLESGLVKHDAAVLEPLRDQWRSLADDLPEPDPMFALLDEDFHIKLSQASGNKELTETLRSVNARIRPVRMYDFLTEDRIEQTVAEHTEVAELLLTGKLEDALSCLHQHVGISMEVVERRATTAIFHMALNRESR